MCGQWSMRMSTNAAIVEGSTMVKMLSTFIAVIVIGCSKLRKDYRATSQTIRHTSPEPMCHSDILNIPDVHLKQRGIPGPFRRLIATATAEGASIIATATAEGASLVATATAAVASAAETAIEALLPRNVSLGISQFCVGFVDHTDCTSLPLNVSDMIPEAVTQFSEDI
ncbi:hypothetical protein G7Y89_g1322 [Cudoniella acicularis]|uniref:Uncharacterized protein n=1 Tax=Cudoniella acicularis TaxID=354080 RepID=A0A8H4RXK0_9HELO|nr:hypothetical protein G7Y89_g1322 [Cudoniella acicularis]